MSTICNFFISIFPTVIKCSAAKNQRIFPVCFKIDFAGTIPTSIVLPQVTLQADDVFLGYLSGFRIFFICDIDTPAGIDRQAV